MTDVRKLDGVVYRETPEADLVADLYLPEGDEQGSADRPPGESRPGGESRPPGEGRPAVMLLHGGGWENDHHGMFEPHLGRLADSAKLLGIDLEYDEEELVEATRELARRTGLDDLDGSFYYRHSASLGYGGIGADAEPPVNHMIVAFPFGRFLGEDALETART